MKTYLVVAGTPTSAASYDNTLTILDSSGGVHGLVNYTGPQPPHNQNAINSIQEPATAAAGRAFYIDSSGTARSLAPDGSPTRAAQFPLQPGQEISFEVRPDGQQLVAVVTAQVGLGEGWRYWVYSAMAGGRTRLVRGPVVSSTPVRLFAWTASGPVVITDATAEYQGCEADYCSPWGHAALVDPTNGAIGAAVGGSDCDLWDISGSSALCSSGPTTYAGETPANLSVRALDGSASRQVHISPRCSGCYYDARLSPGGDVVLTMLDSPSGSNAYVVHADGTTGTMPVPTDRVLGVSVLAPYLWLDVSTVVGVTDCRLVGCTSSGGSLASVDTTAAPMQLSPLHVVGNPAAVFVA